MKLTVEQRKHLVTRTFIENVVTFSAYNFEKNALVEHEEKVGGKFDTDSMVKYICGKYSGMYEAVNPMSIKFVQREVKWAIWDSDFMKYGFVLNDEDDQSDEKQGE